MNSNLLTIPVGALLEVRDVEDRTGRAMAETLLARRGAVVIVLDASLRRAVVA